MEEIINKIFKEKYPKGLSAEYTKEEMVGYMMAINDIKEQLSIHDVVKSFYCVNKEVGYKDSICLEQCINCGMMEKAQ
jgi:hypothetical protein